MARLVAGDVYLVAGDGTVATTLPTSGAGATTSPIDAVSVTFDHHGNLIIGMQQVGTSPAAIDVLPRASGTSYGVTMTAGNIYTIAAVPASLDISAESTPLPNLPGTLSIPQSLAVDPSGNIFVSQGSSEIVFIDEATNGLMYGQNVAKGNAYCIAGSLSKGGKGLLTSGNLAYPFAWVVSGQMTVDNYGNVLFTAAQNSKLGGVPVALDTVWALPATPGVASGTTVPFPYYGQTAVSAGSVYLVAGTPGVVTPEAAQDVPAGERRPRYAAGSRR